MIADTFLKSIQQSLPFELTEPQKEVIKHLCSFVFGSHPMSAYILRGYAGTGKTTIVSAVIKLLHKLKREVVLLAPTGRAAKVLALHAGFPAYTIHKEIYRQKETGDIDSHFDLDFNKHKNAVFFVDEASMLSNADSGTSPFGTGHILDDLISYVYSSDGCRIVFIGDNAQLPPVGDDESPALMAGYLRGLGLNVSGFQLATVMRQADESGILCNATTIRRHITNNSTDTPPVINTSDFKDVCRINGAELTDTLERDYDRHGMEDVVIITRSNKQAVQYNLGIRNIIFGREELLTRGDVVMVVKNNYYWTEQLAIQAKKEGTSAAMPPVNFLANGDIAIVTHIDCHHEFYNLHFADVTLSFPDYDDFEMDVRVLLDALTSESPALTPEQSDMLYRGVLEDYSDVRSKKERTRKIQLDPNYNAVQIKFAYAVTCHKAQGGQWRNVYVDQGWLPPDGINRSYYRWLYTAFTRATHRVNLVNWPDEQTS